MSKDYYQASCHCEVVSPETKTPSLYDEYDRQEYYKEQMFSDPSKLGNYDFVPLTVVRGNGLVASHWSDRDYEEMCHGPCPEIPEGKYAAVKIPVEISTVTTPASSPVTTPVHTRIQVTQYISSKYQRGESGNFEVDTDMETIYLYLSALKESTYSAPKSHRVRVQLQNKVNGKMVGGKNISIPHAHVHEVLPRIAEIIPLIEDLVDFQKVLGEVDHSPKDIDPSPAGLKENNNNINNIPHPRTEDGSGKPAGSLGNMAPPTPHRYRTEKSPRPRATPTDLDRELEIVLARVRGGKQVTP